MVGLLIIFLTLRGHPALYLVLHSPQSSVTQATCRDRIFRSKRRTCFLPTMLIGHRIQASRFLTTITTNMMSAWFGISSSSRHLMPSFTSHRGLWSRASHICQTPLRSSSAVPRFHSCQWMVFLGRVETCRPTAATSSIGGGGYPITLNDLILQRSKPTAQYP